jgi:hypothetical protein
MTINEQGKNNNKWIWIGLGAAVLFCCCAVLVAGYLFTQIGKRVQEGVKTDPESSSKMAHAIVDYELPSGYKEQMAMNVFAYTFVMIGPEAQGTVSGPVIMLAQFNQAGLDQKQMEQQIRRSFEQQSGQRGMNMKVVEVKKMTIRGEEVEVATYEGTDDNGNAVRELISSFPGKEGTAMLIIMGSAKSWDPDIIDAFIKSIH